jgi:CRP-like cAMP-binding protein
MTNDFLKIKQAIDRFQPLEETEWEEFSEKLELKKLRKGDFLIREGQVENHIYFINKGATRNFFIKDGKDYTVDFQFTDEFVTAYYSMITREPSSVFIELLEDSEMVAISVKFLNEFYARYHNGEKIGRLIAEYQYVKDSARRWTCFPSRRKNDMPA